MWFYLLLLLLALVAGLYHYGTRTFGYFRDLNFPFITGPTPFFGTFGPFIMKKISLPDLMLDLYNEYKEYKVFGFFEFSKPSYMICDPELIKLVTVKDFEYFEDRAGAITEEMEPLMGRNLLALEGEKWKHMRSTLSPAFTSSKMKAMFQFVLDCGQQLGDYLEKKIQDDGKAEVEMKDMFTRFANDVIATTAFGIHCDSLKQPENEFYMTGKNITDFSGLRMLIFFSGPRFLTKILTTFGVTVLPSKSKNFFSTIIGEALKQREREGIVRPDMIHLLMEARKTTELSDLDITSQAVLFFLGGFDTASTNLCFLAHMLATHPESQRKLQDEIDATLKTEDGITYDGIAAMKYLDMCVNETMRLWPPGVATNRKCCKPYKMAATLHTPEVQIKKGETIWMPLIGIHRDAQYFPDPLKFDPDRFSDENKSSIQPFTFMPFGTGPRNCIGSRFALMEAKVAIVALLSRFNLVPTAKTSKDLRFDKKGFNLAVEGGFWLGFEPRTGP